MPLPLASELFGTGVTGVKPISCVTVSFWLLALVTSLRRCLQIFLKQNCYLDGYF